MSNCFPKFIVRWILNFVDQPTHENHENDFTVLKLSFHPTNTSLLSYYRQCLATTEMYKKWSKMEKKQCQTVRTLPKSNRKTIETESKSIPLKYI